MVCPECGLMDRAKERYQAAMEFISQRPEDNRYRQFHEANLAFLKAEPLRADGSFEERDATYKEVIPIVVRERASFYLRSSYMHLGRTALCG